MKLVDNLRTIRLDKVILILAVAAVLGWGVGATQDPVRIGMIDPEQALFATEKGKSVRDELERKVRAAEGELSPMIEEFKKLQEELESKKFVLSDSALREKQLGLAEMQNNIKSKQQQIEGELKIQQERLLQPMQQKLIAVIDEIGRDGNFSMILSRRTVGLVYAREALDITDQVVEKFNKQ